MSTKHNLTYIVEVVSYRNEWPSQYEKEAALLHQELPFSLVLEHIGSTAVPGLCAKPIIDILGLVDKIDSLDKQTALFASLGYHAMGAFGIPGRRYFWKGSGDRHTVHLHVFEHGHEAALNHLFFRDYLRNNEKSAIDYARLKTKLAQQFSHDIESYVAGKAAFVENILAQRKCTA